MKELSLPVLPGFHHINPGLNVMWLSSLFSPKATKLLIITLILKTNHENPINYHLQVQITCSTLHVQLRSVQSLSRVWLFETTWTAARQASLSITNSQSLCQLMSIETMIVLGMWNLWSWVDIQVKIWKKQLDIWDWSSGNNSKLEKQIWKSLKNRYSLRQ